MADTFNPIKNLDGLFVVLEQVRNEDERAYNKHANLASLHEGYAVILEELDEVWAEVKKKSSERDLMAIRSELIQVAAMAVRTILDVVDPLIGEERGY